MKLRRLQISWAVCVLLSIVSASFAQQSRKPIILRHVRSETVRDAKVEAAISVGLGQEAGGISSDNEDVHYYYNKVDLNSDGKPELLVFVFGKDMCGTGGCGAFVFQDVRGKYRLVTSFSLSRNPIIVSQKKTRGWNDLIMFVAGGGILPGYYALLRFDGHTYPSNPTIEPAVPLKTTVKGTAYTVGNVTPKSRLVLRAK